FRCHEYGVYRSDLRRERRLRYDEVESFTFAATRSFVNGVYAGTTFGLTFDPGPDRKADRITYQATFFNADRELDRLRDHIAGVIAARMARRLAANEAVTWFPGLRFLPEGLEYAPGGLFGRKEPVLIPYGEVANFTLDSGFFYLWARNV